MAGVVGSVIYAFGHFGNPGFVLIVLTYANRVCRSTGNHTEAVFFLRGVRYDGGATVRATCHDAVSSQQPAFEAMTMNGIVAVEDMA